jgi:phycocyanin beta chain
LVGNDQIDALLAVVKDGAKRTDVVNRITGAASAIVINTAQALFEEQPQLIAPGGNAYANRRVSACMRDMEIILRYVTYAVFLGDSSVLEDRCLNGLRETYLALGVPSSSMANSILKMKDAAIAIANDRSGVTQGDCSALMAELSSYFDRAAAAVG